MRLILPQAIKAGSWYKIIHKYYPSGTVVTYYGQAYVDGDSNEYAFLRNAPGINCHSHVGMDAQVWEVDGPDL